MRMAGLLEVCADSVCSAVNAARGGADRIELCSALPLGGLSPDEDLFCMVRERVDIPVRVLLRPRAGDFLYDEDEFELLSESGEGLRILIGGGVNADVIRALAPQTGADAFHLSAKAAVPSSMEFRREAVPMGAAGLNEFELWRCDEGAVRAAREALDAACTARKEN